jgi:uncharacterized protein (TIGR03382 family)
MAFQFGTNWSVLAEKTGAKPLLGTTPSPHFCSRPISLGMMVLGLSVLRRRRDGVPFAMAVLAVVFAFLMLAASFWRT